MYNQSQIVGLLVGIVVTLCGVTQGGATEVRTVVLKGDPAPGTPSGVVFVGFQSAPSINSYGQVAVRVQVSDSRPGIWSEGSGSLQLVARVQDPVPGEPAGVTFAAVGSSASEPVLSDGGEVTFRGLLVGTGIDSFNDSGIWSGGAGSLGAVVREGSAAPGMAADFSDFNNVVQPIMNSEGRSAFRNVLSPSTSTIWSGGPGGLEVLAFEGMQAPGTPDGVTFSSSLTLVPVFNHAGLTAIRATLTGPGVEVSNSSGIWAGPAGGLELVVRGGDPAPGTTEGVSFYFLTSDPVINGLGQTAFVGDLTGPGVNDSNDRALWSDGPGSLQLVAREGDPATGTPAGVTRSTFAGPLINGGGVVAFRGSVTGPGVDDSNDFGMWVHGGGQTSLVAREGDPAPGTPDGVVFSQLSQPAMNDGGQIVFHAGLAGPGINVHNNYGVWSRDAGGVVSLVIRNGDLLEVAPGDWRSVAGGGAAIDIAGGSGGQDGRPTALNDAGQLAMGIRFGNGTNGVFVFAQRPPGDLTGDGVIDAADLGLLLGAWGPVDECPPVIPADINEDCAVDAFDLAILLANWN